METVYSSQPDLKDTPLEDAKDWYIDGSRFVRQGVCLAGYAVTTLNKVIEVKPLSPGTSAQKAEIIALIRALELAKGKRINVWTDSKYAFGVVHAHGAISLISMSDVAFDANMYVSLVKSVVKYTNISDSWMKNSAMEQVTYRMVLINSTVPFIKYNLSGPDLVKFNVSNLSGNWSKIMLAKELNRPNCTNTLVRYNTGYHSFVRALIPSLCVYQLERAIVNISDEMEIIAKSTADALFRLDRELQSLKGVVMQNRMTLDKITANVGGVCTLINTSCCNYVDESREIEINIQKIWEDAKGLHQVSRDGATCGLQELWDKLTSWLPNFAWLKQLFALFILLIILGILICLLLKCFMFCSKNVLTDYESWKKHQLRQKTESGKYFRKCLMRYFSQKATNTSFSVGV
nr:uncharacterized protein LOC125181739 [Anser cygnoides]